MRGAAMQGCRGKPRELPSSEHSRSNKETTSFAEVVEVCGQRGSSIHEAVRKKKLVCHPVTARSPKGAA